MTHRTIRKLLLAWLVLEIIQWPIGFLSRPYHAIGGETISLIVALYAFIAHSVYLRMED